MPASADSAVLSEIVFTIRTVARHTVHFMIIRCSVLSALWYIRSILGQLIRGISYLDRVLTITSDCWMIGIEGIFAALNTGLAWNNRRQSALIRIHHLLLRHTYCLLLLLITWIVEVVAEEYVVIINCMVQLLFLISLLIFLITVVIHIVYLLPCIIVRLVRFNLRRHRIAEWIPHHLRRTSLDLGIKLIRLSNRTFLDLHRLILLHVLLLGLHHIYSWRSWAIHFEILMINVRHLLLIWPALTHHLHIMLIKSWALMPRELPMVAIHHVLLRLLLHLGLTMLTGKVDNLDRKITLWTWLRYILSLRRKGSIFEGCIIGMRVKSQLIIPRRLEVIWVNWCTVLVVLAAHGSLMRNRHIFGVCLLRKHLVFVHKLVITN